MVQMRKKSLHFILRCGTPQTPQPRFRLAVWRSAYQCISAALTFIGVGRQKGLHLLVHYAFPEEHWRRIRTNNPLERILREIRRRTRVVGSFPDGQSALNLAAARLRHIAGTACSTKRYLNIELLKDQQMRGAITA
jgi:Transposase, Mutator family